jgi:hypothetical protein
MRDDYLSFFKIVPKKVFSIKPRTGRIKTKQLKYKAVLI